LKGGWFIGGSAGSGMLIFHGRRYPLSIGSLSAGLVFGGWVARLYGYVSNIHYPSDVAGVGAGAALVVGGKLMVGVKFASTGLGKAVAGLIHKGFLNAVSVGWRE
jgi:hypothetical protein